MDIITQTLGLTLAYLDPGTGSMILQGLIGILLGGIYILKLYWYKVTGFFTGNKEAIADDTEANNDE